MAPDVGLVDVAAARFTKGQGRALLRASERYLQLCAEQNMQVCVPSTPHRVYHMLRRQALRGIVVRWS